MMLTLGNSYQQQHLYKCLHDMLVGVLSSTLQHMYQCTAVAQSPLNSELPYSPTPSNL